MSWLVNITMDHVSCGQLLDEVLPVGSQKKGVALAGCKTADAVIIFKKAPTGMVTMAIVSMSIFEHQMSW